MSYWNQIIKSLNSCALCCLRRSWGLRRFLRTHPEEQLGLAAERLGCRSSLLNLLGNLLLGVGFLLLLYKLGSLYNTSLISLVDVCPVVGVPILTKDLKIDKGVNVPVSARTAWQGAQEAGSAGSEEDALLHLQG